MSVIAKAAATREYTVTVEQGGEATDGEGFVTYVRSNATALWSRGMVRDEFFSADEVTARARANAAWVNLRNGHLPLGNRTIFVTRCVQCGKPGTAGRPLLNGRQGLTHDSCDNYR